MDTLACGHAAYAGRSRLCPHLLSPGEDDEIDYIRLLTGRGIEADLCCEPCDLARQQGTPVRLAVACEGCVASYDDAEAGSCTGWRGEPGIVDRPEPVDPAVVATRLPGFLHTVPAMAPLPTGDQRSVWLLLTDSRWLISFDADNPSSRWPGPSQWLARTRVPRERDNTKVRPRLHTSADGRFAAVVNDFGRYGEVIDLTAGKVTLKLDNTGNRAEHVPFSLAFTEHAGRTVVVHRTSWNRLDISDAATGRLLTAREPAGDPAEFAGLYRGALAVSAGGRWIADDSWAWSPFGVPYLWDLERWLSRDVWESDTGASRQWLCQRFDWNTPMRWIGDDLLALSGIGDEAEALAGVRIFDATSGREVQTFAGPRGALFSSGRRLYAAGPDGLEIWDPFTGARTGRIPGFTPSHHHRGTGELAALTDGHLLRWRISPH
ncbi:hypothetical protein [Actinoplanes derwentensis]|uniref:hypothetical protein n=1 Tax=Actinoplanes derwentensis TaxID=113562 RepID=UPI0018D28CFA|nr:hypothetical protein [Actinoplanes derwentensis]